MAVETLVGGFAFLLGRIEEMTGYAAHKGVPAPGVAVVVSGAILVAGGIGIIVGAFPVLSAGAIAVFLTVSALTMHDFWNSGDPEEQQSEMTQFLKNAALTGGALILLAIGGANWPFAVGPGF
ncbi:MAG: DoxX family protein [Halobacteria archaeon]|nr:DoxX family protein [Halobacteria archaeon]